MKQARHKPVFCIMVRWPRNCLSIQLELLVIINDIGTVILCQVEYINSKIMPKIKGTDLRIYWQTYSYQQNRLLFLYFTRKCGGSNGVTLKMTQQYRSCKTSKIRSPNLPTLKIEVHSAIKWNCQYKNTLTLIKIKSGVVSQIIALQSMNIKISFELFD
jgi:hypothetical protein